MDLTTILPGIEHGGASHVGTVREDNQDSIQLPDSELAAERGSLYAVADGMGGYAHGRMASTLALQKLYHAFYGPQSRPALEALKHGVESANLDVYKTAQRLGAGRMGTTLTAASVVGNRLVLAHVGDSRAYLVRNDRAVCLTDDHTTVGELVRLKVLSPDQVRTHAQRSILTRGIGLTLFVKPDLTTHPLQEGDQLILCSDGVWSVIEDREFAELARRAAGAEELSQRLIDLALERQSDDNVSAISVRIQSLTGTPSREPARKGLRLPLPDWLSRRQTTT